MTPKKKPAGPAPRESTSRPRNRPKQPRVTQPASGRKSTARPRGRFIASQVPTAAADRPSNARPRTHAEGAVLPSSPDTPGSDPSIQGYRDQVRTLVRDGMPSYADAPYGLARQEQLSDQIGAAATPIQTEFCVRWTNVPLGKNATFYAVAGTIAAYVDGSPSPRTLGNGGVTSDIDVNGNFTLAVAPTSQLLVTYGWQILSDGDVDQQLDLARSWLQSFATLDAVPDGLQTAVVEYAAHLACKAMARQLAFPDVEAGEAKESLSSMAKQYEADAKDHLAAATTARADYWKSGDQPLQPQATVVAFAYPAYQPIR